MLKLARPETKIIACEPAAAALMSGEEWHPHKIQGWTPDLLPEVLDTTVADEILKISDEEAIAGSQTLATQEGIFTGTSGGATYAGALRIAEKAPKGSNILFMVPDTAERYISTPLFEDINDGNDDEDF